MAKKPETKMHALLDLGQSVWLDYLGRGVTRSGELERLIDGGLRGMTSNPTIFEKAITGTMTTQTIWSAIERCLAEGININITLLFSVEHYRAVADA